MRGRVSSGGRRKFAFFQKKGETNTEGTTPSTLYTCKTVYTLRVVVAPVVPEVFGHPLV